MSSQGKKNPHIEKEAPHMEKNNLHMEEFFQREGGGVRTSTFAPPPLRTSMYTYLIVVGGSIYAVLVYCTRHFSKFSHSTVKSLGHYTLTQCSVIVNSQQFDVP